MMRLVLVRIQSALAIAAAVLALGHAAWASDEMPAGALSEDMESAPELSEAHQWSVGVSKKSQDAANQLYLEGNALFLESQFRGAKKKYTEALALWSHPSVHYNLALTLINLDAPLEANKHLVQAMQYGGAPLDARRQKRAFEELRRTGREISGLELRTREPGCTVRVDGQPVEPPVKLSLPPGNHVVSVRKGGYVPREYRMALFPGTTERLETRLYTSAEMGREPWTPNWIPVLVTGSGAAMLVTGAVFALQARQRRDGIDEYSASKCAESAGCSYDSIVPGLDRADKLETLSTAFYISGAVIAATGVGWLWFSPAKRGPFTPEQLDRHTRVAPLLSPSALGAMAAGMF